MSLWAISTLPLPVSFTESAKLVSRPPALLIDRNAWCGRFAVLPSCVVKMILSVSVGPRSIAVDRGLFGVSLQVNC